MTARFWNTSYLNVIIIIYLFILLNISFLLYSTEGGIVTNRLMHLTSKENNWCVIQRDFVICRKYLNSKRKNSKMALKKDFASDIFKWYILSIIHTSLKVFVVGKSEKKQNMQNVSIFYIFKISCNRVVHRIAYWVQHSVSSQ